MHFPQAITATLVGSAVGPLQRASTTREALAVFDDGHSIGACYQPAQSHPFLNSEIIGKSVARSKWGLPQEPSFIVVCVFKLDRLEPKSIPMFVRFLLKVPDSYIVFVERANGMRGQIIEWLNECDPNHPGIVDRFLFRPSTPNTKEFCTLLDGADASLDSLGHYSAHTTAGDAVRCSVPHFTLNDPQGLMQSRVGAEVSIAAGLEQVCVGKT
jgi:predicted O-linked N-acetylglucosamine transferase (SPINDLY family)